LAAADELFYAEGIHAVGIDRVLERAGVAKASLYSTFGSKEQLVREYLMQRHVRRKDRILAALERHPTPRAKLLGFFDAVDDLLAQPTFQGCAFINAAVEEREPGGPRTVSEESRGWVRSLLVDLARQAGSGDPEELAGELMLLYDGAVVNGSIERDRKGARIARRLAERLIDDAVSPRAAAPHARRGTRARASSR
jgi:AcrR family transcriptional regulator